SASVLRELGPHLADIHGQHDQQLLFLADAQRDMLDAFGGHADRLERLAGVYANWRAAEEEFTQLEQSDQEKLRMLDLWSFQRKEIESAALQPDEDTTLEQERRILHNLQRLEENAGTAYAAIYDSPESALSLARQASKRVDDLCRIDAALEP